MGTGRGPGGRSRRGAVARNDEQGYRLSVCDCEVTETAALHVPGAVQVQAPWGQCAAGLGGRVLRSWRADLKSLLDSRLVA